MEIDNRWIAKYEKAIEIIKSEVKEKLSKFELIEENSERKTNYYYLVYNYNNITIELGGERGFIIILLTVAGVTVDLYRQEKEFDELEVASENNFIIVVGLLKEYLEKNKLI